MKIRKLGNKLYIFIRQSIYVIYFYKIKQPDCQDYDPTRKPMNINKIKSKLDKDTFNYYMKSGFTYYE